MSNTPKPVVLCILDGWGYDPSSKSSAIAAGNTPNYDRLMQTVPFATLNTSGLHVGLPDGQMGNSEVGHMNLGSGRVVLQDLPRIDKAVEDGTVLDAKAGQDLLANMKQSGGTLHMLGLLSPGGVHSHQDHMAALVKALTAQGIKVAVHGFLDGRDTPPKSAAEFVSKFETDIAGCDASLATLSGRFYAMDRDKRWDRVEKAFAAMVDAKGQQAASASEAVSQSYAKDETDEFVLPTVIGGYEGMKPGDGILMANFRADRAREILTALVDPAFDGFNRARVPEFAAIAGMVEYSAALNEFVPSLFPAESLENVLGDYLSGLNKKQLHIAETEKYAHVTFFFNGGREEPFEGEDRVLVPSPQVATYDLQPEMSAPEVTDKLVAAIAKSGGEGGYDFIVVNFANPDMVGHTGIMSAAIKAVETIDACVGRLEEAVINAGGTMLITADHGNVEQMVDPHSNNPHTAHTTFVVPFLLVGAQNLAQPTGLKDGRLADVAPTVLALMGLEQPPQMTGNVLLNDQPRTAADYAPANSAVA